MIAGVIFDLDGVLVDSETAWNEAREALVREQGGHWTDRAQRDMMGMSSIEWSRYLREELGVPLAPEQISDQVVRRLTARYRHRLPLIDGARAAVERMAESWPLALASSANRPVIDLVLELGELEQLFRATVSSEEVVRGKPAPDVYLEAATRLGIAPVGCAAVEDSHNGILSARAAGMRVVAIPNPEFPPGEKALEAADVVVESLQHLTPEVVDRA